MFNMSSIIEIVKCTKMTLEALIEINKEIKMTVAKWFCRKLVQVCLFFCLLGLITSWGGTDLQKYGPLNLALNSRFMKCKYTQIIRFIQIKTCSTYQPKSLSLVH